MQFIQLILILTSALLLAACATNSDKSTHAKKLSWEKSAQCRNHLNNTLYDSKSTHNIYLCTIHYTGNVPKMFPSWETGKVYMGAFSRDRKFILDPIYEHVYTEFDSRSRNTDTYVLFKKYGETTYTRGGYKTDGSFFTPTPTPIEHLALGYVQNSTPCRNPKTESHVCEYSAAFSNNKGTYYLLNSMQDFSIKIENVDTDTDREEYFPSVYKLIFTNTIFTGMAPVMVRHNLNGNIFYQIYTADGAKLGPQIPYEKVVYFHLRTSTYELNKTAPYQVRPWIHRGGDFYLPIIYFSNNTFYDINKPDYGNFLGATLKDFNGPASQAYTGAQVAKHPKFKTPGGFAFKDDQGVYYSYINYDIFMYNLNPDLIIPKIQSDSNNFYRDTFGLPYYTGYIKNDGQPEKTEVRIFENMDNTYRINSVFWKTQSLSNIQPENTFTSIEAIETVLIENQKKTIASLAAAEKKRQEQEAYEAESKRIKDKVAKNMASRWAEQDRKEKEHADRMKVLDHNEKYKKPNPLLTLDLKKIYDSEGAERRAACFRKMSDSKKAFVSGRQNWHFQGKCK